MAIFGWLTLLRYLLVKTALLAALLFLTGFHARAQEYYLDLSTQTLGFTNGLVGFTQVLDGRAGHPPIGVVYRGLGNKSVSMAFRRGLETELAAYLQAQWPSQFATHRVALCLRGLRLGETLGGTKEQASGNIIADVYEELPDGYHFVQRVSAQVSDQGTEVSGRHANHMALLLHQCVDQLNSADWTAAKAHPAQALAALRTDVPTSSRRAAILREAPRRGLYYRYDQFLANRPDTVSPFRVDTIRRGFKSRLAETRWQGVARVRPEITNWHGKRPVAADLWGFCDGQQAYVRHDNQFFPLMRQGDFFTFVGEAPFDQIHAAAQAQAQRRAMVLAGAIGVAVSSTNVPDHTAEPTAYGLDLTTGALGHYPGQQTPARLDTAYLYLYRPGLASTASGPVGVYVEDHMVGTLQPGQYLEVPWFRFGKPMRVCLSGLKAGSACQYLVPNTAQLNYLRINPATAAHPWQWVPPTQGAADLDELDKQHEKK